MRNMTLVLAAVFAAGAVQAAENLSDAYDSALAGVRSGAIAGQPVPEIPFSTPAVPIEIPAFPMTGDLENILKNLPAVDIGKHGHQGSPLSLIFIGTKRQVQVALGHAHWTDVPRNNNLAFVEGLGQLAAAKKVTKYPPFHFFRVEGKKQDSNWAQVVRTFKARHHFRLWKLNEKDPGGRQLWWGSASYDTGIRWKLLVPVTHNTSPDVPAERDYIARSLLGAPGVVRIGLAALPQIPREGENDQKESFFTDGKALVVELGPEPSGPAQASADAPAYASLDEPLGGD
ncbi:MAG: LssY C-terminal domain-containing protein [Elusimicrobiota bacterium]